MINSNHSILITGASRGIGLEFVKQYTSLGCTVYACVRAPEKATDLNNLAKLHSNIKILKLDVENRTDLDDLSKELNLAPIDILINCAGIFGDRNQTLTNLSDDNIVNTFNINSLAPLKVCAKLADNVINSQLKTIVTITSKMGSIADNVSGGQYAYRASKAAVNMMMKSVAVDLQVRGIKVILLHPGWVQTDMGGSNASTSVVESVSGMLEVINHNIQQNANELAPFYAFDGSKIPW